MKLKIQQPFFMEIVILAAWGIWMSRNNKIFRDQRPTFDGWKVIFLSEITWLKHRIKAKYAAQFSAWLQIGRAHV